MADVVYATAVLVLVSLAGIAYLCRLAMPAGTAWWLLCLSRARQWFGIGYLSEFIGRCLLPWARLQYPALPCCTQFYSQTPNAGRKHHCDCIRVLQVISADEETGVRCQLTRLDDFATQRGDGPERYNCLSYTWGEPLTPFPLDGYRPREGIRSLELTWAAAVSSINTSLEALVPSSVLSLWSTALRAVWLIGSHWTADAGQIRNLMLWEFLLTISNALGRTSLARGAQISAKFVTRSFSAIFVHRYILICNDQLISITPNLWNALMTSPQLAEGTIWIDAVCINQGSETEKGDQVRRMHDIYRSAKRVIVWIGPEGEGHDLQVVRDVASAFSLAEAQEPTFWQDLRSGTAPAEIRKITIDNWLHVARFLSREYWVRKWIIQEVVAAEAPEVVCGRLLLTWEAVCLVSRAWHWFGMRVLAGENIPGREAVANLPYPHLLGHWRTLYQKAGDARLRHMFGAFTLRDHRGNFACFDGRDVLYALVGICNYPEDRLEVTYRKPVSQVYTEFWARVLQTGPHGLSFLSYVEDKSCRKHRGAVETWWKKDANTGAYEVWGESTLPSWAPDFALKLEPSGLADHYSESAFSAAGHLQFDSGLVKLQIDLLDNKLTLRGFFINTIGRSSETNDEVAANHKIRRLLHLVLALVTSTESPYDSHAAKFEALWRSMSVQTDTKTTNDSGWIPRADATDLMYRWLLSVFALDIIKSSKLRLKLSWPTILSLMRDFDANDVIHDKDIYSPLQKIHDALAHSDAAGSSPNWIPTVERVKDYAARCFQLLINRASELTEGLTSEPLTYEETSDFAGLEALIFGGLALLNRRLFLTDDGFIGKGPKSAQPGDQIWIFAGSTVPLVLRRVASSLRAGKDMYQLVGHAYLDGLMHGEAVKSRVSADAEEVVLV